MQKTKAVVLADWAITILGYWTAIFDIFFILDVNIIKPIVLVCKNLIVLEGETHQSPVTGIASWKGTIKDIITQLKCLNQIDWMTDP